MCTSSDDSREPAHKRTLCRNSDQINWVPGRNDIIQWVYEWRYLLFDFDIYRICLVIMCNYQAAYTHVSLVACSNMRALLHAYLVGLEALDLFLLSLRLHAPPFFMCAQTQQWMRCVCVVRLCICPGSSELSMFA